MKKSLCCILLFTCLSATATAQSPIASVVAGYSFTHNDQGSGYANLNGWFGQASFTLTNMVSLNLETDNYYGSFQGSSVNQHSYVAGPQFTFNSSGKLQPFVNVEAGDQRSSSAGSVSHAFTAQFAGGVQLKLSQRFGLYLSPVEYDLATPSGGAQHSFSSKFGVMVNFGQKH